MVKQKLEWLNINILGIIELKWMRMCKFNSDHQYLLLWARISSKEWISSHSQRKSLQYHGNPSLCSNHYCWRNWSWLFLWKPTTSSRSNAKKRYLFHHRGLESKSRKMRDTQSHKFSNYSFGIQNEAVQRLLGFCQENKLVIANTLFQQTKNSSTHRHGMVNSRIRVIISFTEKDGKALSSQQNRTWSRLWLRS